LVGQQSSRVPMVLSVKFSESGGSHNLPIWTREVAETKLARLAE
jgi:hypothetical protein